MSEELTLLQKLMTSKPPTRRITLAETGDRGLASSKPPTRRITNRALRGMGDGSSKPPIRRSSARSGGSQVTVSFSSRLHGG